MATALKLAGSLLAAAQSVSAEAVDDLNVREHIANVAKIAAGFGPFAGSDENAVTLVESLRSGFTAELRYPVAGTDPEPRTVTITSPTGPLAWHDVRMCLMLARDALTAVGILRPSGEQLLASLVGGEVPVPGIRLMAFKGVLNMRAEGCSWGKIASERYQRAPISRLG